MSTFKGILVDFNLRFLSIDYFGRSVYHCDHFFLSHHHCDHMKGLFNPEFTTLLNTSDSKQIFCSPVTAHILRKNPRFRIHRSKVVKMEIDKPLILRNSLSKTDTVITALPANHCPGSVMFLLECENKRILYTGDIRITLEDIKSTRGSLINADGSVIAIDDLYLDTTFALDSSYDDIPSREKSEETIVDFIRQFRAHPNPTNEPRKTAIYVPTIFGYENLYKCLRQSFGKRVMVHNIHYRYYEDVEEMQDYFMTVFGQNDEWDIHICVGLPNRNCDHVPKDSKIQVIRPCALKFVKYDDEKTNVHCSHRTNVPYSIDKAGVIRVLYSTHCSLNELRELDNFLKPKELLPSVTSDRENIAKIKARIRAPAPMNLPITSLTKMPLQAPCWSRKRKREEEEGSSKRMTLMDL